MRVCAECGRGGADVHTQLCPACFIALPPYFRRQAEHQAIDAALLRQALMGDGMGGIRWTEQQYQAHLRQSRQPAPREDRKAKGCPVPVATLPDALAFTLWLTPMRNGLDRMHFRAKRRLLGAIASAYAAQLAKLGPLPKLPFERARVEIVRMSAQAPDPDGLQGSVKPLLDALQRASERHPYGAGIIVNDDASHLDLHVRWEKAAPRKGGVLVLVSPR